MTIAEGNKKTTYVPFAVLAATPIPGELDTNKNSTRVAFKKKKAKSEDT